MDAWLKAALAYIPQWIAHQMRASEQPGCALAVAHGGRVVLETAFGHADLAQGAKLTARHRFRVASHSKTFTAAGIMKLREQGRLRLDDPAGRHVDGLHREVAQATIAQLLSHGSGIIRDGTDAGQWQDRRPFLDAGELRAALALAPIIPASARFKYSNHGYGLAGLVIEAVTGEPYTAWIRRTIVEPSGLAHTEPDMPIPADTPFATGHGAKLPLGRRFPIPGRNPTNALAAATGFVSTVGDLARFFGQLDPAARRSVVSPASRREFVRRQWRDPHASLEGYYCLGTMSGSLGGWEWFGHGGRFQGTITRTAVLPGRDLAISVATNALDGSANLWVDGVIHILRTFAERGAPAARLRGWSGRWWGLDRAADLVPVGERVLVADPSLANPFMDASEIAVDGPDRGTIVLANGYASHGEGARLVRRRGGKATEFWLGGIRCLPEARLAAEIAKRYG